MLLRISDQPLLEALLIVCDLNRTYYEFSHEIVSNLISHPSWFSKTFQPIVNQPADANNRVKRRSWYPARGFNGKLLGVYQTNCLMFLTCFNPLGLTREHLDLLTQMIHHGIPKNPLGIIEPEFRYLFHQVFGIYSDDETLGSEVDVPGELDPIVFIDTPLTPSLARYLIENFRNDFELVFEFQDLFVDPMVMNSPEFKDFLDSRPSGSAIWD